MPKTNYSPGVGDLVRPIKEVNCAYAGQDPRIVTPFDVGLVTQSWEPTVEYPAGCAEVHFSGSREIVLMWKEVEIVSRGRRND